MRTRTRLMRRIPTRKLKKGSSVTQVKSGRRITGIRLGKSPTFYNTSRSLTNKGLRRATSKVKVRGKYYVKSS